MALHRVYGRIEKVTPQDDGTLIVEGVASSESVDSQGEIVKASAMRSALPDFMKFANVREMHQPIAAGKALAVSVDDAGITHIEVHVVDAGSCKKVETGVLQGFSIGGSVPAGGRNKDNAKVIEQLKLTEISLVDRPANPDAMITLVKIDDGAGSETAETAALAKATLAKARIDAITKGLYSVGYFAGLIQSLDGLAQDTQWEKDWEGDDSEIPAKLKAAVSQLCALLREMVAEETAELVGEAPEAEAIEMAAKPGALAKSEKFAARLSAFVAGAVEKKGAKFSKATSEAIGAIHKCVKDAHEKLGALGYDKTGDDETKDDDVAMAAKAADLAKAEIAKVSAELEKRAADAEAATKLAGEALKKVLTERDALTKRNAELEVEVKKKGSLMSLALSKEDDAKTLETTAKTLKPVPGASAEAADAAQVVKAVHSSGGTQIR